MQRRGWTVGKLTVECIEEHEDGSATVVFECDDATRKQLINEGLISLLKKAVDMEAGEGMDSVQSASKPPLLQRMERES